MSQSLFPEIPVAVMLTVNWKIRVFFKYHSNIKPLTANVPHHIETR